MPPRTELNDKKRAEAIKERRLALGMSIEEAARRAGVGMKTWCRYESAEAIRSDKVKGVCKALGWSSLPSDESVNPKDDDEYTWLESIDNTHEAWSPSLEELFGRKAAVSFALGSDLLLDWLSEDLSELGKMSRGSHLGEVVNSWMVDLLPQQFVMRYDYEFVFRLRAALVQYRKRMHVGHDLYAHTVAEELLVRLIRDQSFDSIDGWSPLSTDESEGSTRGCSIEDEWKEWPEEICGDDDFSFWLNDSKWNEEGDSYNFMMWFTPQFYLDQAE